MIILNLFQYKRLFLAFQNKKLENLERLFNQTCFSRHSQRKMNESDCDLNLLKRIFDINNFEILFDYLNTYQNLSMKRNCKK